MRRLLFLADVQRQAAATRLVRIPLRKVWTPPPSPERATHATCGTVAHRCPVSEGQGDLTDAQAPDARAAETQAIERHS